MITNKYPEIVSKTVLNLTANCTICELIHVKNKYAVSSILRDSMSSDLHRDVKFVVSYKLQSKGLLKSTYKLVEIKVYYKDKLVYANVDYEGSLIDFSPQTDIHRKHVSYSSLISLSTFYPEEFH